jgi:glycosyltransferase involved in cell wall biosynthesis
MFNFIKYMKKDIDPAHDKWLPTHQGVANWEYEIGNKNVQDDLAFLLDNCDMTIAQKFHWYGGLSLLNAQRTLYPNKPFYSEFDDHVFAINPDSPAVDSYYPGSEAEEIVKEQVVRSSGIIVSTEYLRQVFEKINPNVWVIPNAIDFQVWDALKKPKKRVDKKIRIGWAGGGSHVKDLEFILPALNNILNSHKNVEIHLLGGAPTSFLNNPRIHTQVKWHSIDKYPQAIRDLDLDIAIAPLRDNAFNRGKSNLRWLEYSALKVPTVCSRVEPFKCVDDLKTGLLATEPEEWEDCLFRLINNASLRKKIGVSAYEKVKNDYNAEKVAKLYSKNIGLMLQGKANISREMAVDALSGNG